MMLLPFSSLASFLYFLSFLPSIFFLLIFFSFSILIFSYQSRPQQGRGKKSDESQGESDNYVDKSKGETDKWVEILLIFYLEKSLGVTFTKSMFLYLFLSILLEFFLVVSFSSIYVQTCSQIQHQHACTCISYIRIHIPYTFRI